MLVSENKLVPNKGERIHIVDKCAEVFSRRGPRPTIKPWLLVVHYAVTDSLDATYRAQELRGFYAHLSVYERGVIQQVPFDIRGAHAGESIWNGFDQCNDFSIGIEIANPGPLVEKDGSLWTVYGKKWPWNDAVQIGPPEGYPKHWRHWARYPIQTVTTVATIALALKQAGLITDVVGHSDISPGRKFDPGPAFPLEWLRSLVFPGEADHG